MKLKVLKQFHDKETDRLCKIGDIIEVNEKRGKEILANKFRVAELVNESGAEVGADDKPTEQGKKSRKKK